MVVVRRVRLTDVVVEDEADDIDGDKESIDFRFFVACFFLSVFLTFFIWVRVLRIISLV